MKNIKRALCVVLCLALIGNLLIVTAFADNSLFEVAQVQKLLTAVDANLVRDDSVISRVQSDLNVFASVGFDVSTLTINNVSENSSIEYKVVYSSEYTDYIYVSLASDGSKNFTITENDIVNTVTITKDGEYYVDGQKIEFCSEPSYAVELTAARARGTFWAKTPFVGTKSEYTIDRGLYKNSVVDTVTTLCDLATSTIQMILAGALDIDNVYNVIMDSISLALKIRARETAPTSHYLSCSIRKYEHNSKSNAFDRYYMYQGNYYPTATYSGNPVQGEYYEHNYFF